MSDEPILCRDGRPIGDDCPDCNARLAPLHAKRERRYAIFAKDVRDWTDDDLDFILRERYAPTEVPPCAVCGGPLTLQACGGGEPSVWACAGYGPDGKLMPDRRMADEHYSRSCFTDRRQGGDEVVIELLRRSQETNKAIVATLANMPLRPEDCDPAWLVELERVLRDCVRP